MKTHRYAAVAAIAAAALQVSTATTGPSKDGNAEDTIPARSVIDEVIWVVGDEPILKSDVEAARLQAEMEGVKWGGDPDCVIPERLAVQRLFLNQAALDSIEVSEADVAAGVDAQVNHWIQLSGSKEKLEEYRGQSLSEIRAQLQDDFRSNQLIGRMKDKITENVAVTPAEVRRYFEKLPADSLPFVPTEVEVEIITQQPSPSTEEVNRVKDQLREYTERVVSGETTFSTLARLYSEDPGSARQGGELGFVGRGTLDPAFAAVAFNLTDPKKISKVVETEFGFHIIQLIEKRGDKVNVRHILLKPKVSDDLLSQAAARLDSVAADIRAGKFSFEEGATFISDDKDTRNNHGLMSSANNEEGVLTSKFRMRDLPTEVAREVEKMSPGEVSNPFTMVNSRGKAVSAIIKLVSRTEGHKADISKDFQVMKKVVVAKEKEKAVHDWVVEKIKHTYVKMADRYKGCNFEYQGWVK